MAVLEVNKENLSSFLDTRFSRSNISKSFLLYFPSKEMKKNHQTLKSYAFFLTSIRLENLQSFTNGHMLKFLHENYRKCFSCNSSKYTLTHKII